ncbi:MAG: transporter [Bacteroidota bacterium]
MKTRFYLLFFFFSFCQVSLSAQFAENIRSGRPGQGIGAYTLGAKVFQLQSGVNYNSIDFDTNNGTDRWLHNTVVRLGLVEKWEVSAVFNWRTDEFTMNQDEERQFGISNTQIGARYNVVSGKEKGPTLGIQARALLRAQSEAYRREKIGVTAIAMSSQSLSDKWGLLLNVGMTWTGNNTDPRSFYALSLNGSLSQKWSTFVEVYGNIENPTANYDAGFAFLVNPDFQLDISAGWQGDEAVQDWFVDGGISWRIVWRE